MDCINVQDRLAGYLQDDLRLTERLIVEVHIAHCGRCRADLDEIRDVVVACRRVLRHPAPKDCYAELRGRLALADMAAAVPLRERLQPRGVGKAVGIAAACLIMAGASSTLLIPRSWPAPLEPVISETMIDEISIATRASESTSRDYGETPFDGVAEADRRHHLNAAMPFFSVHD